MTHGDLEIGSFAGDISLYLAPPVVVVPEEDVAPAAPAAAAKDRFGSSDCNCTSSTGLLRRSLEPEWASPVSIAGERERGRVCVCGMSQRMRRRRQRRKGKRVITDEGLSGSFFGACCACF